MTESYIASIKDRYAKTNAYLICVLVHFGSTSIVSGLIAELLTVIENTSVC